VSAMHPCATVWDALERHGYGPHGQTHDFRSRCPAHNGDNASSLHVCVGADGRAVLWCHARQCAVEDVVSTIGLSMPDLFPAGYRRARRRQLREARRSDFTGNARQLANVLMALVENGAEWYAEIRTDCPHCGSPRALLRVSERGVWLSCPGDEYAVELGYGQCTFRQFQEALAGRLQDRKKAA
jgi:hypothetical protein